VGNPSGPVKFSGQPQYDSEQVVSPLFTFSAPPMAGDEGEEEETSEATVVAGTDKLLMTKSLKPPARAPKQALYQTQQKLQAPTRTGNSHVSYAAGYAAGLDAAKKSLLHAQATSLAARPLKK